MCVCGVVCGVGVCVWVGGCIIVKVKYNIQKMMIIIAGAVRKNLIASELIAHINIRAIDVVRAWSAVLEGEHHTRMIICVTSVCVGV